MIAQKTIAFTAARPKLPFFAGVLLDFSKSSQKAKIWCTPQEPQEEDTLKSSELQSPDYFIDL